MKGLADEMAAAGKKIDDDDLISQILAGLDADYNPFVSAISASARSGTPLILSDLFAELLVAEGRLEAQNPGPSLVAPSTSPLKVGMALAAVAATTASAASTVEGVVAAMAALASPTNQPRQPYAGGGNINLRQGPKPVCQICGKTGHTTLRCWKRFEKNFRSPLLNEEKSANTAAAASYGVDTNWYSDTGATDHITSELDKLSVRDRYNGTDQVHTTSGSGMEIMHIGHTQFHTHDRPLHLNNVLHVPQASKNLISVHKLAHDNHAYLEFWPEFFSIKDQETGKVLLRAKSRGGLYPLPCKPSIHGRHVLGVSRPSSSRWHRCLGHPSFRVVSQILTENNLPFSNKSHESVCDACQKAKSHQLPYPSSTSVSKAPLELIFSDVWGPAPTSVGRNKYYVSFIDDFSKFTWIYLLRQKSEVFQKFNDFQQHVEQLFDRKF